MDKKLIKLIVVLSAVGILFASVSGNLCARAVWRTGTVTKAPWLDRYQRVGINDIKYTFMPDIRLEKHVFLYGGGGVEEEISFDDVEKGDEVLMRVQGHRIYEFIIEEGYTDD